MLAGAAGGAAPAAKGPSANRSLENPFDAPLLAVRPRVFIRKDNFDGLTVARLREAVGRPEFVGIRQKWRGKPLGRAIEWMIDGRKEDLDAAVAGLKKMDAAGGTWSDRGLELVQLAALFDWLCDELDEPTRQAVVARLEKAADAAAAHVKGGQAPFFYSRTPGALAGLAVSGIALKGVSDKADGYLALFRDAGAKDYFKAYEWLDGAATGATYTTFYTYVDLPAICAAWWSATGRNPADWIRAAQGDWLDGIVRFYLWYMRPGFAFTDINDQSRGVWETHDQFCQGLDIALYVTGNGCGRAWSERWRARFGSALYHPEYAHNYLFRAAAPPPRPLTDLPLAQLFGRESCGYGFFRSAWPADGQPDTATHVFFRCGDPVDVHGGVSAGEFQVFRYAPLAARSGRYSSYDSPPDQYHRNCISTNVVLFLDPADPKDRGDQNTRRGLKSDHKTWADWLAIRQRSGLDVACITDWQAADGEARCRADLTRTNPDTKCKGWVREFVWLARKHLVVLDVVETARPDVRRLWQLHSPTAPQIGDHLITIANRPPDRKWADEGLRPKNEEARLFCRTLLPEDYAVVLHSGGKAEAFAAAGQSRGGVEGNPYHLQYGSHVVQVDPAGRGGPGRTVFLHVLTAVDAAETTPPKAACRLVGAGRLEVTVDGARTVLAVPEWFKE
jgi:hypothetical protein